MKGDFSRVHDERRRHYSKVLMQQGRLLLDADFNAHVDHETDLREITTLDVIGRTGAPRDNDGFFIAKHPDGNDLLISAGRMYVDGILCECDGARLGVAELLTTRDNAAGDPDIVAIVLDGWTPELREGSWVALSVTVRRQGRVRRFGQLAAADPETRKITFKPLLAGVAEVHWVQPAILWSAQPDVLEQAELPDEPYLVYLDVWKRHITALEDPLIRETALGGPDTTTRVKTVWQVRVRDHQACNTFAPKRGNVRMAAQTRPAVSPKEPCEIPEAAGYRRLENQLYRVEIHAGGDTQTATFKWSRDNGAIVFAVEKNLNLQDDQLQLRSIGLDERTQLQPNDWVELIDDRLELEGLPGKILRVEEPPEASDRIVTMTGPVGTVDFDRNPRLRVWGRPDAATGEQKVSTAAFVDLEDGIQVKFAGNDFRTGDYWLIPARTAISAETGKIEWPLDDQGDPMLLPPRGITHHYAPLAEVFENRVEDCRALFAPATSPDLLYLGGDAQEAELGPGTDFIPLVLPLRAGVSNGMPVAGATVRFTIENNAAGELGAGGLTSVDVRTNSRGIAQCAWKVNRVNAVQTVRAELVALEAPGEISSVQPIVYHARLRKPASSVCTIVVKEGDDVAGRFAEVEGLDYVEICFGTGRFDVGDKILTLQNHLSVKITGAGAGTVLTSNRATVIGFNKCKAVVVRDLSVNAGPNDTPATPDGALLFDGCGDVKIENVGAKCETTHDSAARNCFWMSTTKVVNVRRCTLAVGARQNGIAMFDPESAILEENRIVPFVSHLIDPSKPVTDKVSIAAATTRAPRVDVTRFADFNIRRGQDPRAPGNVHVPVGPFQIGLTTTPPIGHALTAIIGARAVAAQDGVREEHEVVPFVNGVLQEVFDDPLRRAAFLPFVRWVLDFGGGQDDKEVRPVGNGAGIAVHLVRGGISRITIRDNEITGMYTAINVGMVPSDGPNEGGEIARAVIESNYIEGRSASPNERIAGICVGSCRSLLIDGNRLLIPAVGNLNRAVFVDGSLGPFAIISNNDVDNWGRAVEVVTDANHETPQWRLQFNRAEGYSIAWIVPPQFVEDGNVPPP